MIDEIVSRIFGHPVNRLVYSCFGFFARHRGGEISGRWLVAVLGELGISETAVRQVLYRMQDSGEILARKLGRHKLYRPTPYAWAALDAGAERLRTIEEAVWDGEWTLVYTSFGEDRRSDRDRVRTLLRTEGFAPLGSGAHIHPRDRSARLLGALGERGLTEHAVVIRGSLVARDPVAFAREHWDLRGLELRYRSFLDAFAPLDAEDFERASRWTGQRVFGLKLAVVLEYLDVAWDDPDLPGHLLPEGWPGGAARRLAAELNRRLLPLAIAHGDSVLDGLRETSRALATATSMPGSSEALGPPGP